jgi:hypothetical protein
MTRDEPVDALRRLAAAAAAHPQPAAGGPVHYVRTSGSYLASSALLVGEQLQHLDSRVEEVEREIWLLEDGSGRIEELRDGRRSDSSGTYGPGQLELAALPSLDAGTLGAVGGRRGRSHFRVLEELWSTRVLPPMFQSQLLQALAMEPGDVTVATVIDRLGRDGLSVAAEENALGTTSRYVVVLSQASGQLLAAEEVALDQTGWLLEPAPCTTSYTAFITSALVEAPGSRPAPRR